MFNGPHKYIKTEQLLNSKGDHGTTVVKIGYNLCQYHVRVLTAYVNLEQLRVRLSGQVCAEMENDAKSGNGLEYPFTLLHFPYSQELISISLLFFWLLKELMGGLEVQLEKQARQNAHHLI
jgi:hypothetical protein